MKPFDELDYAVEKARGGDERRYNDLLWESMERARLAAKKFDFEELDAHGYALEVFPRALDTFRMGSKSFWGYFENILHKKFLDVKKTAYRRYVVTSVDKVVSDFDSHGVTLPKAMIVAPVELDSAPQLTIVADFPFEMLESWINHRRHQKALSKAEAKALRIEISVSSGVESGQMYLFESPLMSTVKEDLSLVCSMYLAAISRPKVPRNLAAKLDVTPSILRTIRRHYKQNGVVVKRYERKTA